MAPIRVAIIGLSSQTGEISASPGDGWAASAHLPYFQATSKYEITALCNTSEKSARHAIEKYNLPASTKAYGSPEDLAKDPDVDLVVCNTRVDRHYKVMMPILQAGKNAYVEWPLGANLQQAEEMLAAAQKSGSKTIVGLQARNSPVTLKVKQLVEEGAVGDLLSSELQFYTGIFGDTEPPGIDYLAKKEVGGNLFTIPFAHMADPIFFALGKPQDVSALLDTRVKQVKLLKSDGSFDKMIERETPDQVLLHTRVSPSGAPVSMSIQGGKQFKGSPAVSWCVYGTKGEIRLTSGAPISMSVGGDKIELFDHAKDSVEEVKFVYKDAVKDLPPLAKNIAGLYELFADGGGVKDGLVRFEEAVDMHRILVAMEKSSEEKKVIKIDG